jgi:Secretion system C-terminal sorting domain
MRRMLLAILSALYLGVFSQTAGSASTFPKAGAYLTCLPETAAAVSTPSLPVGLVWGFAASEMHQGCDWAGLSQNQGIALDKAAKTAETRFKFNALADLNHFLAPGAASIQAFPNPAIEWVRFDARNVPTGNYTLSIFNIIGRAVWKQNYKISGAFSVRVELDKFKKGTYLYSLMDGKGTIIGTKRLVIIKP